MTDSYNEKMLDSSHISAGNAAYVDQLFEDYLADPNSVSSEWQAYFSQLPQSNGGAGDVSHEAIRNHFAELARKPQTAIVMSAGQSAHEQKQTQVMSLINAYRINGHMLANLDPLQMKERKVMPDLDIATYHLNHTDMDIPFNIEAPLFKGPTKLKDIIAALEKTYCSSIGVEYMHIADSKQLHWLQQRFESVQSHPCVSKDEKLKLLKQLTAAEGLEKYLGSKYVGQKRFSLEGGDSLIPMMHELIERAASNGVKELVIGMAHRGRLNVLVNVLGKSTEELFQEFEGLKGGDSSGDVKYHMGFSSDIQAEKGKLHLALAFNPSHLEIIAPVVQGSVRSRQRRRHDLENKSTVIPIIMHGDAAFAAQGVVMESFNFSQARGYSVGGTIHIVINNQVGFTTSNPLDARSTLYCTDVAKMVQAPVLHVNSDDPEAVIFAMQVAFDFRMQFKRDVVIDLVCYRRHGHNEADEPSVTQPLMYQIIRKLPTTRTQYADKLMAENIVTQDEADALVFNYRDALDRGERVVDVKTDGFEDEFLIDWSAYANQDWRQKIKSGVPLKTLQSLSAQLDILPDHIVPHPVLKKLLDDRVKMGKGDLPINWGYAEIMAYASLLVEGYPVRLSGQDSGRGTFAHRHAVIHDYKTAECYIPLQHLTDDQKDIIIIDSVLTENAVVAFEYGYTTAEPNALVIWEAQFGDFANGAQVVFDQFISSGEQKWGRLCGLVMFLPHGYEGQGPEHSSARLERFLQLCAQQNMQVCVPSTPAQAFHMIRRQVIRNYRKPLVVMTPKSLLRHKLAVSTLDDLVSGEFQTVIGEIDELKAKDVTKVVLCSGKVYYDLLQERRKEKKDHIAIVRIEQLYPFPLEELQAELAKYKNANEVVWCQEEPKNQGAWYCSRHNFREALVNGQTLRYAGRADFAAPAVGYYSLHVEQQRQLVEDALK